MQMDPTYLSYRSTYQDLQDLLHNSSHTSYPLVDAPGGLPWKLDSDDIIYRSRGFEFEMIFLLRFPHSDWLGVTAQPGGHVGGAPEGPVQTRTADQGGTVSTLIGCCLATITPLGAVHDACMLEETRCL